MAKNEKIVEASAIMLKELDSLRRQKREWELQRATLLSEGEFSNKRIKLHIDAYQALTLQFNELMTELKRQIAYNDELHKMLEVELPLHQTGYTAHGETYGSVDEEVSAIIARRDNESDGPDDVDVERMQSTADHDPESLVGEEAYE